MLSSTISARNIIRYALSSTSINIDKHSYTDKTSVNDPNRRSVVFKTSPINNKEELIDYINSEFEKFGYSNKVTITNQRYPNAFANGNNPYTYIRVIAYI
jgi:hypothetical protein